MRRNSNVVWVLVFGWALTIFATSCTFIERSVFINFVKRFIPVGVPQNLWVGFWGACGLLVVKAYHVTEYAVLCTLLNWLLRGRLATPYRAITLSAGVCILYAASDEWHQTFVPGRGGTWVDVVIDSLGVGLATAYALRRVRAEGAASRQRDDAPRTL